MRIAIQERKRAALRTVMLCAIASAVLNVAGCAEPTTATTDGLRALSTPVRNSVIAGPDALEFDMTVEVQDTSNSRRIPRSTVHVSRAHTSLGWRYTYFVKGQEGLATMPGGQSGLARVEIDETGNERAFTIDGKELAQPTATVRDKVFTPAVLRGIRSRAPDIADVSAAPAAAPPSSPSHSWLNSIVSSESRQLEIVQKLEQKLGAPSVSIDGSRHYVRRQGNRVVDYAADPMGGRLLGYTVSENGLLSSRVRYDVLALSDGSLIRWRTVHEAGAAGNAASRTISITLTNILANGKGVGQ